MEETFRLVVLEGRKIALPLRLLRILRINEDDEVRIVTNEGRVTNVTGIVRDKKTREQDDAVGKHRLKEIRSGRYDDTDRLAAELKKPGRSVANVANH
jgi:hypothetical protein